MNNKMPVIDMAQITMNNTLRKVSSLYHVELPFAIKNIRIRSLETLVEYTELYEKKMMPVFESMLKDVLGMEGVTSAKISIEDDAIIATTEDLEEDEYNNLLSKQVHYPVQSQIAIVSGNKVVNYLNFTYIRRVFELLMPSLPHFQHPESGRMLLDLRSYPSKIEPQEGVEPQQKGILTINRLMFHLNRWYNPKKIEIEIDRGWRDAFGLSLVTKKSYIPELKVVVGNIRDKSSYKKYTNFNIFCEISSNWNRDVKTYETIGLIMKRYTNKAKKEALLIKENDQFMLSAEHSVDHASNIDIYDDYSYDPKIYQGQYKYLFDNEDSEMYKILLRLFNVDDSYVGVHMNEFNFLTSSPIRNIDKCEIFALLTYNLERLRCGYMDVVNEECSFMELVKAADLLNNTELLRYTLNKAYFGKIAIPSGLTVDELFSYEIFSKISEDKVEDLLNSVARLEGSFGKEEYFESLRSTDEIDDLDIFSLGDDSIEEILEESEESEEE